jgi:hypothetical protein
MHRQTYGRHLVMEEIEGLSKLLRNLAALGIDVDYMKDVMASIAAEGAQLASGFAPHKSGALAASIRGNRAKSKAVVSAGRASVPYAGRVNYQAGFSSGYGFLQKADDALRPHIVQDLTDGIARLIAARGLA